jgi:pullulanase
VLVQEDAQGRVLHATRTQIAGALDALYADAETLGDLGVTPRTGSTRFRLWAPTAQAVALCLHADGQAPASAVHALRRDARTGSWQLRLPQDLSGRSYTYLVDVAVPGMGVVRNRVTDPYSISLSTQSARSWIGRLDDPRLQPEGWSTTPRPDTVRAATDQVVYELHLRDFSLGDASVPAAHRGRYLAFTHADSHGMRHLKALAAAGLTDVHLLPRCRPTANGNRRWSPRRRPATATTGATTRCTSPRPRAATPPTRTTAQCASSSSGAW